MSLLKKNFSSLFFILILFLIDRLTKFLVVIYSNPSGELIIPVTSFLKLNLIWNNGIAFGLLSFQEGFYHNLLTVIIIIITLILSYFMISSNDVEKGGFCLIIGGSLGNIFDRIYYSSVIDFIDFHINNFHWFIFNIADMFITLGVFLLILFEFIKKKK